MLSPPFVQINPAILYLMKFAACPGIPAKFSKLTGIAEIVSMKSNCTKNYSVCDRGMEYDN